MNYYNALCAGPSKQEKYQGRVYRIIELSRDAQQFYENNTEYTEQAFMGSPNLMVFAVHPEEKSSI